MTIQTATGRGMLVWDQHSCLPLRSGSSIEPLKTMREAGFDYVSVNVGFDTVPWQDCIKTVSSFRAQILENSDEWAVLVSNMQDVYRAKDEGKLAIAFDLEGTDPLNGRIELIRTYYDLGVRTMLIAYNRNNPAGGGCHDNRNIGLTKYGRAVLAEMNQLGMVVDGSHSSSRTTMDLFELSTAPVVFSHSVPEGIKMHPRNISDAQITACAQTGGVIGINGVGIFLGDNRSSSDDIFRAIDYTVELVGAEHVGVGLDYVFDQQELANDISSNPTTFPADGGYLNPISFVAPSQIRDVARLMQRHGYPEVAVEGILGGNFARVASNVWK